jgi:hypothetical protein
MEQLPPGYNARQPRSLTLDPRPRPKKGTAAGPCGPAAPMRQRSCRGAGSTTAALAYNFGHDLFRKRVSTFRDHALELLLALDRR